MRSLLTGTKSGCYAIAQLTCNVSDQDGISAVVCKWPDLVCDYSEAVLTPNFPEYQRLCMSVGVAVDTPIDELAKR